jgi:arabinogalactan oligomer/maltooligosaccharide transport system permease protein
MSTPRPHSTPTLSQHLQGAGVRTHLVAWVLRIILIAACVVVLLPALWTFSTSIQPGTSGYTSSLWPSSLSGDNYSEIFNAGFWTWLKNSLLVSVGAGVVSLLFNVMGAFAFSRLQFVGRRYGLLVLFLIQVFPQTMAISAIFTLVIKVNLYDSLWGIFFIFIGGSAFNMWLLKNYMDSLPRELDESARVDGANTLAIFTMIILPLMIPSLFTMFLFGFVGAYNDFIWGSLILQSSDNYTMTVGLYHEVAGQYNTNWSIFAAGAVLATIPILVLFFALQRFLVSGLSAGSVKG